MERDLTLFITNDAKKKIKGTPFSVKLVSPEVAKTLQGQINAIKDLNQKIADAQKAEAADQNQEPQIPSGNTETSSQLVESPGSTETEPKKMIVQVSSKTGAPIIESERLLIEKEKAIASYKSALEAVAGDSYSDTDQDGKIYVKKIDAGDYIACFQPMDNFDANNYAVSVNVKDKLEYVPVPVEQVEQIKVAPEAAGDVQPAQATVPVEAVPQDSVKLIDSRTEEVLGKYESTASETIRAFVSGEMNTVERQVEIADPNVESGGTQSGTLVEYSAISISKTVTLYSGSVNSASIVVKGQGVKDIALSSSDPSVVSVSGEGESYTLTAGAVSSDQVVKVIASGKDVSNAEISAVCEVKVVAGSTALTDAGGNELYKDAAGTEKATVSDYVEGGAFYKETEAPSKRYFGWQKLNGIQYYYDENGNPVSGEQTIGGNRYNFGSDGALLTSGMGIDVSKWQGNIDWSAASSSISFAIIRAGFRGSSGNIAEDPKANRNIAGAKAAGVKVGLYIYSMAMTEAQAVEEASLAVAVARRNGGVSLPIYIDMEDKCQLSLSKEERNQIVLAFCKTIASAGYRPGVYANKNWLTNYLTPSQFGGYSIWCAQYNTSCTYGGRYDIWQYTSKGTVPGISGNVDMNQSYF